MYNLDAVALNRIYYGIFYIVSALAIKNRFSTANHSQLIGWFNTNYVKTSKTTDEGDTDNGSTYNALDLPFGYMPMDIASWLLKEIDVELVYGG